MQEQLPALYNFAIAISNSVLFHLYNPMVDGLGLMLYPAGRTTAAANCLASQLRGMFFITCTLLSTVMDVESEPNLNVTGWNWAGVLSMSSLCFLQLNKIVEKRKTEIIPENL
jgi:hypothetical protein